MRNKKLITPLFIATSFLLVGCSSDTIVARPTWIDGDIIDISGIKDNKLKSIYDAVKKLGDTNSAVLNKIMYEIAKTHIGDYDTIEKLVDLGETAAITDNDFKNFVNSHEIYKSQDEGSELTDMTKGTVKRVSFDNTKKLKISYNKLKLQLEQIQEDIAEKLYDEIKGGSYSNPTTKIYNEKYFVNNIKNELYSLGDKFNKTYISGKPILVKPYGKKYVEIISNYLTLNDGRYGDYIERKILPDLYKTYLTETYVKQQRYSSLGRSYARKVDMVAVPYGSYKSEVNSMMLYFSKQFIAPSTGLEEIEDEKYDFTHINNAMIGFSSIPADKTAASTNYVYQLLNYTNENIVSITEDNWASRRNFERVQINKTDLVYYPKTDSEGKVTDTPISTYVYKGTKLGDMIEKLLKFTDVKTDGSTQTFILKSNRTDDEDKAYNDFTSNQSMSIEDSIILKEQEARSNNLVKEGWFLKNGGLTDLDSDFRDNLFNITTSNIVDNHDKMANSEAKYGASEYVRYFGKGAVDIEGGKTVSDLSNRKAFLTTSKESLYETLVLKGKSSAFIVEVKEAPNTAKLSTSLSNISSYANLKATSVKETSSQGIESTNITNELVRDIVKANSSSDTYKKNANEYYLMISNIVFYDQSVYDYFKSQFPDLFK